LNEHLEAAEARSRVRYDDASHFTSHFICEDKHHFDAPTMRDVEMRRWLMGK